MEYGRTQFAMPSMTWMVKRLLIVNFAVFLLTFAIGRSLDGRSLSWWLGLSGPGLFEFWGLGVLRLITYQFAHDYLSLWHILLNMLVLYFFGTMVEGEVGRRGLLRLYLMAGVVGGLIQLAFAAATGALTTPDGTPIVTVGASGACYGILLYAACMAPRARVIFIIFPIELRWLVAFLLAVGLYSQLLTLREGLDSNVAHGAHLGGALWGFVAFRYLRRHYMTADHRPSALWSSLRRWRDERRRRSAADRQAVLDKLLEKVHREGMSALTPAERRFLERASRDMRDR